MKKTQYRIRLLLLAALVAAFLLWFFLPFRPSVTFEPKGFVANALPDGGSSFRVHMTNTGSSSIWYVGNLSRVEWFTSIQVAPDGHGGKLSRDSGSRGWMELSPGHSVVIDSPIVMDMGIELATFSTDVSDWRGRVSTVSSGQLKPWQDDG